MKIIINRSDALGDTLLSIFLPRLIKQQYPHAKIAFITQKKAHVFLERNPFLDELWSSENTKELKKHFKKFKANYYFFVGGSRFPSYLAWLRGVKYRAGLLVKGRDFLFLNYGQRQRRSQVVKHEAEYNLDLFIPLLNLQQRSRQDLWEELYIDLKQRQEDEKDFRERYNVKKPYIVIHPGMTGHSLNLSVADYASLVESLEKLFPQQFKIILSYTPSDEKYLQEFRRRYQGEGDLVYFNGAQHGLLYYIHILSQARLYIGGSTGPTHIAQALKTPLVSFYSPLRVQSSRRWGTLLQDEKQYFCLSPQVTCPEVFRCKGPSCRDFFCMEGQSLLERGIKAAKKILSC